MSKKKQCECQDRFGVSSPDCTGEFVPHKFARKQVYCSPCKATAKRAYYRDRVKTTKYKRRGMALAATNKKCTICKRRPVHSANRFLCYHCWIGDASTGMGIWEEANNKNNVLEACDRAIEKSKREIQKQVVLYSPDDYTQEELQQLIDECR